MTNIIKNLQDVIDSIKVKNLDYGQLHQLLNNLKTLKDTNLVDIIDSLDKKISPNANGLIVSFLMEDYGKFLDQGVKGADPSSVVKGRQKAPNSDFSFKSKKPPMQPLANWAKLKKIRLLLKMGVYIIDLQLLPPDIFI